MIKYKALFSVDGGLFHKFGSKEPHYYTEERIFKVDKNYNDKDLLVYAARLGHEISIEAYSNPETGVTKVTLLSLIGPKGEIDQEEFISKYGSIADCSGGSFPFDEEKGKMVFIDYEEEKFSRLFN